MFKLGRRVNGHIIIYDLDRYGLKHMTKSGELSEKATVYKQSFINISMSILFMYQFEFSLHLKIKMTI